MKQNQNAVGLYVGYCLCTIVRIHLQYIDHRLNILCTAGNRRHIVTLALDCHGKTGIVGVERFKLCDCGLDHLVHLLLRKSFACIGDCIGHHLVYLLLRIKGTGLFRYPCFVICD